MVSTNAFHSATPTRPSVDEKSSSAECSCASQLGIAVQSPGSCPSPSDQHFPCSAKRLRQGGRVEQIPPENLKQWLVVSIYHMVTSSVHFVIHRSGHAPIFADAHQDPHIFADHPHGSATAWSSLVVTLFGTYYFLELEVQSFLDQFCKYGHECQYNFCIIKCLDHGHRYKNCLLQKPLFLWPGWRFVCWDPREKITLYFTQWG